jgi:hypothetical protein
LQHGRKVAERTGHVDKEWGPHHRADPKRSSHTGKKKKNPIGFDHTQEGISRSNRDCDRKERVETTIQGVEREIPNGQRRQRLVCNPDCPW